MARVFCRTSFLLLMFPLLMRAEGQVDPYPHNAATCERCHNIPSKFGGSTVTVLRDGNASGGKYVPAAEGGIHHRYGESGQNTPLTNELGGLAQPLISFGQP